MTNISFDFTKTIGRIKPMHAVGQPPFMGKSKKGMSYIRYLKEANIPYARLHDVGGAYGGFVFVDIPNIFRDFEADETDPNSYDFVFTDILIAELMANDCPPVYRLGVTIENQHNVKAYRIFPPKDTEKWARICEHIVRHYNEGWAEGFHYDIKYWEIWNEPDNGIDERTNMMWHGTKEEYFELYRVTSKHLRKCFGDSIKIGGYGSSGLYAQLNDRTKNGAIAMGLTEEPTDWEKRISYFDDFFIDFLKMVSTEKLPLDFYSHHSYEHIEKSLIMQKYVEEKLDEYGLGDVEIHLNEWNANAKVEERGTAFACASSLGMMCEMQNHRMEMMCFYDARIGQSVYGGLFNPLTYKPMCTYYGFQAFGKLYGLGTQVESIAAEEGEELPVGTIYALAATDGCKKGAVIVNLEEERKVVTNLESSMKAYVIDDEHFMEPVTLNAAEFTIQKNQVIYLEG